MSDFAPGDVVKCVNDQPIACRCGWLHRGDDVRAGSTYRVISVAAEGCTCPILMIGGDAGGLTVRFRKIRPADEQFTETVRACKPIKQPLPSEKDRSLICSLAIEEALERSRVADERVRVWIEGRVK